MKNLILDFVLRRWWLLAVVGVFAALGIATGQTIVFTPFALVGLLFDAQRGLLRAVRPLPVTRRAQARAWWFICVLLAPLVTVIAQPAGVLIFEAQHLAQTVPVPTPDAALPYAFVLGPNYFAPWFAAGIGAWVGLGYAALCYLLCIALPTRPASTRLETLWQHVFGGLWGLAMSGPMLWMFVLPKNPGAVQPWHWLIFALVPVLVAISFRAAPEIADRRMSPMKAECKPAPVEREVGGQTGIALFLLNVVGRTMLLLVATIAVQIAVFRLMGVGHLKDDFFSPQLVTFAIVFGSISGEAANLRVLRALPLSTAQLAALLLSVPIALGLACATFITVLGGVADPSLSAPVNFLARLLTVGGAGALAFTLLLHIATGLRFVVLMICALVPAIALIFFAKIALWLLFGGSAALIIAGLLLLRGLRRSSAFYQPRGYFGVNASQPLSGG